jgi:capsular exopolysaccharide synthesis family protein
LTTPPNPSELLSQDILRHIVARLQEQYDYLLFDTPPVNAVTDPIVLSRLMDGLILVVQAGKTTRNAVINAKEQLEEKGANILGCVLNGVDLKRDPYYNRHYYGYSYHKNYYGKKKT